MSSPRLEVVTEAVDRHWARFITTNGRTVWVTETYRRKHSAENAIEALTGTFIKYPRTAGARVHWQDGTLEVRYVDQRLKPSPRPALPTPGEVA